MIKVHHEVNFVGNLYVVFNTLFTAAHYLFLHKLMNSTFLPILFFTNIYYNILPSTILSSKCLYP